MNSSTGIAVIDRTQMSSTDIGDKESDTRTCNSNDLENAKFDQSKEDLEGSRETPPESKDFPDLVPSKSMDFPDGADDRLLDSFEGGTKAWLTVAGGYLWLFCS